MTNFVTNRPLHKSFKLLMAGLSERQLKAISDNPINNSLDQFRATLQSKYCDADVQGPLVRFERLISDSGEVCRAQLSTGHG